MLLRLVPKISLLCRQTGAISRVACRAEAEHRFSVEAMADGYEAAYRRVLGAKSTTSDDLASEAMDVL